MKFKILNTNTNKNLIDRLLENRKIDYKKKEEFLNPSWKNNWNDPFLFEDMEKAVERIKKAIKNNEKIIIFWDYDADGITASYVLAYFIEHFLKYKNIEVVLANRQIGYWLQPQYIDIMDNKPSLIITVDNWITSVEAVEYAKKLWIDVIITDHHEPQDKLPDAFAIINPKVSKTYPFKDLAWVGVAFKLVSAFVQKFNFSKEEKEKIINYFIPIVAIWTVTDVMPLVWENRLFVKKWLEIMNDVINRPLNIRGLMSYLRIENINTYHLWFIIWPRLNASWRMDIPDDAFYAIYHHNFDEQFPYLNKIESFNKKRQEEQEKILDDVERKLNFEDKILIAGWEYREWIVWIIAWKLTERYHKPAIIMSINKETWEVVWSCRSPSYFSIIDMLEYLWWKGILEKYGGHKQAGWFSLSIDKLKEFKKAVKEYEKKINDEDLKKTIIIDTILTKEDILSKSIEKIPLLEPFWVWNYKPTFILKNVIVKEINFFWIFWKKEQHAKIKGEKDWVEINLLKRNWAEEFNLIKEWESIDVVVDYTKDDYNWGFYFTIIEIIYDQ